MQKNTKFDLNLTSENVRFNERRWRQSRYKKNLGNVCEGQGFADKRKRETVRQYAKLSTRNDCRSHMTDKSSTSARNIDDIVDTNNGHQPKRSNLQCTTESSNWNRRGQSIKMGSFQKAKLEHKQRMEVKEKHFQEMFKRKEERETALKSYKEKKLHRRRKLLNFTKKGQPVMKGRVELLLETLERQLGSEKASHSNPT